MCGFVGVLYFDRNRKCSSQTLEHVSDVIVHRGPDDAGIFCDDNYGVAHRRLSIISPETGHQPITCSNDRFTIAYNGEIYNFHELRSELTREGYVFRTLSDTEVILGAYELWGTDSFVRLNGIFSFSIWDSFERKLLLVRDRIGIKPLYYARSSSSIWFGSEIKAILASGDVPANCAEDKVMEYFLFRCVSAGHTLFDGVEELLPGQYAFIDEKSFTTDYYWSFKNSPASTISSYSEACDVLDETLRRSVKRQLISDVPLGTFCSGGIDSSLVTALAARSTEGQINTYSVGFSQPKYDESSYARKVSNQYHTQHHLLQVDPAEFLNLLPQLIWHNDQPMHFANSIHIYALSRLARKEVTVVLTGEGADELFCGYPRYLIPKFSYIARHFKPLLYYFLKTLSKILNDHRVVKLQADLNRSFEEQMLFNTATLGNSSVSLLFPDGVPAQSLSSRKELLREITEFTKDPVSVVSLLDQNTYLQAILKRQDKMSMATSIESRVPFLDNELLDFANSLPSSFRLRGFTPKRLLKDVALRYLPRDIVERKKSGFGVPLVEWFMPEGVLADHANRFSCDSYLTQIFEKSLLDRIVNEHQKGYVDHSEFLWSALNYVMWRDSFSA